MLPRTFSDVIRVARDFKFYYLWIDALCIAQDCEDELNDQIEQMGKIYTASSLTIFAVSGLNSDDGLDSQRSGRARKPTKIELRVELDDTVVTRAGFIFSFQYNYAHMAEKARKAPLFARGWVLQEQVLSPRSLLISRHEISWRCLRERSFEIDPGCNTWTDLDVDNFKADHNDCGQQLRSSLYSRTPRLHSTLLGWYNMVEAYSEMQLTKRSDIIPAISGIATLVSEQQGLTFVAGLWKEDIARGLLWRVDSFFTEPDEDVAWTTIEVFDGHPLLETVSKDGIDKQRLKTKILFPSWSWLWKFHRKGIKYDSLYQFSEMNEPIDLKVLGARLFNLKNSTNPHTQQTLALMIRAHTIEAILHDFSALVDPRDGTQDPASIGSFQRDLLDALPARSTIRCVLCAVFKEEQTGAYSSHCVGVTPVTGERRVFVRVGYVRIKDHGKFFGDICQRQRQDMEELELI